MLLGGRMQFLDRFSIRERMIYTFLFIAFMLAVFSGLNVNEIKKLGTIANILYEHPLRVSKAALIAQNQINRMQRHMLAVSYSQDSFDRLEAIRNIQLEDTRVLEQFDIIQRYILGPEGQKLGRETRLAFDEWRPIRLRIEALISEGKLDQSLLLTQHDGASQVTLLDTKLKEITDYAQNKADGFVKDAMNMLNSLAINTLITLLIIFAILFLLAFTIIRHTMLRMGELQATLSSISKTGTLTEASVIGNNEIAELASNFNILISSLKRQFWLREGMATLNKKLAVIQSIADTSETAINFTSRHVGACAGAIFLHDPNTRTNTMLSSFCHEGDNILSRQYADGESIVGQVARDKQTILLKEVPADDALVTSGTMRALTKEILVVPLVYNNSLVGILELASLSGFDAIKCEFIDLVAQQIAISMNTSLQREHINILLEATQAANKSLEEKGADLVIANEQLATRNEELQAQSEELHMQAQELKGMAEELTQQKYEIDSRRIQVEEADRLKSEFLSNMSHELRTPLNSILALSQLMISKGTGLDTDKDSEYLSVIERNGRHLLSLINDILDLSKIEAGRMDIFTSEFNPVRLVEETIETIRPLAEKKGIQISFSQDIAHSFVSDSDKIRQIVLNLISNAVKFTDVGGVTVTLHEEPDTLSLAVADTGIGIEEKDLSIIFDEFRQVDGSTTRKHDGTGLGLAICKKLAILLGGDLYVDSAMKQGSTFTLTLPRNRPVISLQGAAKAAHHTEAPNISRSVLIVDDDVETRKLLATYLSSAGYEVMEAHNGAVVLEIVKEQPPMAILLDISMPDMDGWEILRQLRTSPQGRNIPVIMVSVTDDKTTGIALGASGYLVKPVSRQRLLDEIQSLEASKQVQTILVVDDDDWFREQMALFLKEAGYSTLQASNGESALEMAAMFRPDAMLLDLVMPGISGFDVLQRMEKTPSLCYLPVLIVTAKDLTKQEKTQLLKTSQCVVEKNTDNMEALFKRVKHTLRAIATAPAIRVSSQPRVHHVLVVEDNEIAAMQIAIALEEVGCTIHHAADGDEAIQLIKETIPDAIILDLMMPGIDGFDLLETLRSKPETARLPVVVVTAKELTTEDRARLSNNNISQLIRKGSLNRDQLKEVVLHALNKKNPSVRQAAPAAIRQPSPSQYISSSGQTILIVEDNEDNLLTIQAVLQDFNGEILIARNGEDAVTLTGEKHPDIVLMDIQLPGMSGLEATRLIKAEKGLATIPIIALTARAMEREREEIFGAGCDEILTKPYDPDQLWSILTKWLSA